MIKKEESRPVGFIRQNQPKNSLGIWYDGNGMIVALEEDLQTRLVAAQVGHHYAIQKNRTNNQIVTQNRDKDFPKLCAVEASINIAEIAMQYE